MKQTPVILIALIGLMIVSSDASAKDYNKLGVEGYAHWRCAAIGSVAGEWQNDPTIETLFVSGHVLLTELVTDIVAGRVSDGDLSEVPIGLTWALGSGPSVEF